MSDEQVLRTHTSAHQSALMREGKRNEAEQQKTRMGELGGEISALESELRQVEADLEWAMLTIPNHTYGQFRDRILDTSTE